MAKAGYYGGDPRKVLEARADDVVGLLDYERFTTDLENAYIELNREESK